MAIGRFLAPLNGQMVVQQAQRPYVDDIFDPLFNAEVTNYYRNLYGPLGGIGAGYAAMLDNALTGRKGILGPGMGILSTFGRSMDKADDFILGGLTEGVNALGQITGGNNQAPTNPISNIFVNDYDYQGTKLMAAMGNAMSRLTGTQTPLDESDFQSLGDKIAGTSIDLATDPGIMGGQLARLNPGTPVGRAGQILSDYDDVVANIAGNMAFPGGKALIGKGLTRIRDFLGGASSTSPIDIVTHSGTWMTEQQAQEELGKLLQQDYTTNMGKTVTNIPYNTTLRDIAEDYAIKADLTPLDPEYAILEEIRDNAPKYTDTTRIPDSDDFASASDIFTYKQSQAHQKYLANAKAQREALAQEIEKGHQDYLKGVSDDVNKFVTNESKYIDNSPVHAEEYTLDLDNNMPYEVEDFGEEFRTHSKITVKPHTKHWVLSHNEINKVNADKKLQYLQNYVTELKSFDKHIFDTTYLKNTFEVDHIPYSPLNRLMSDNVGGLYFDGKVNKFTGQRYKRLMNELYDQFIPWVRENEHRLATNKTGQRLIDFADDIENTLFKIPDNVVGGRIALTEAYSPLLQGLTSITKDSDINSLDEFIRLKQQYPHITLMLQEGSDAYYAKKLSADASELQSATAFPIQKLTTMDEVYENLPKSMLKPLGIPKKATDLYKGIEKAVKDPTAPFTNLTSVNKITNFTTDVSKLDADQFTKMVATNKSMNDISSINILEDTFKQFADDWEIAPDPENLQWYIRKYGTSHEKTLFQQWTAAVQSKVKNKLKTARGVFNIDSVKQSKQIVDDIVERKVYTDEQIAEYISRKDLSEGVTLKGENFLESLWASQGFKEIPIPKRVPKERIDAIAAAIKKNVDIVNKNGSILKFVDIEDSGTRRLAVFFDTDNLNIKKDIGKIYGLFGKKDLGLQDVVVRKPLITKTSFDTTELDRAFDKIRQSSKELTRKLGYTSVSPNYISHAMEESEEAKKLFSDIYKSLGIDKDKLEKITQALQDQDIASGKLQFGSIPMERSHLGYFGQYGKGFSTDLKKIHSSTFTNGMLDNTNAQTFFDLFVSDNFKINQNFESVAKLKEALNLTEGNMNNLSIVKPRYNESGKLIGFTKYDKFSDAALQKAFTDNEAILVPDSVIGSLDRMCKKDARMSSKVYRFINKYLTVPFKFGTLANPGFLAGNIQDAYFKQATELAKKYNTTLSEELTNVAFSMRQVIQLNNQFSDVFDGYRQWLKDTDLKNITRSDRPDNWYLSTFKKSKNMVDTLTADQMLNNPELYSAFKEYLAINVDKKGQRLTKLYLYLNNNQTTTMFKNNNRDLENLSDLVTNNPYAVPNNIVERIMYGDPSKTKIVKINGQFREVQNRGFNSYGLFLNNPVSNGILKASNTIENWMRSSTILNDLQHQGYTIEDICDILGTDKTAERAIRKKFGMSMNEALNTMYAANFDYDNVSSFMNKMSYILPFPTFYLKNLAFWADIFTNKPQYIDNIISVHEGLWAGKSTKDEFIAEAKGRGAIPIGQQKTSITKHLTGIVKQTPYNSMFGAFNAINNFKEDFAYRTNPGLRPIARHLQPMEDVRYRPYNTNQYQKNIKKGDPEFSNLAYMFHQLNPYERFINTGLRIPGKISNNTYQLSDFLPSMIQPDFSKK